MAFDSATVVLEGPNTQLMLHSGRWRPGSPMINLSVQELGIGYIVAGFSGTP